MPDQFATDGAEGTPGGNPGDTASGSLGDKGQSDFAPDQWGFNYRGQTVLPQDRNQLLNWANQGYDYSKRMEGLNQQTQEMDNMKREYGQYAEWNNSFREHPDLANRISQTINDYNQGQTSEDPKDEIPGWGRQMGQQFKDLSTKLGYYTDKLEDRNVQEDIGKLKGKYKNYNWDLDQGHGNLESQIIGHMKKHQYQFPSIEAAFRDYMWDSLQASTRGQALSDAQKNRQIEHKQGILPSGGGKPVPTNQKKGYKVGDAVPESYQELAETAKSRFGG